MEDDQIIRRPKLKIKKRQQKPLTTTNTIKLEDELHGIGPKSKMTR